MDVGVADRRRDRRLAATSSPGVILGGELVEGHGVRGGKAMIATLRRRLIAVPARLVSHGGQLIMRLAPGPCLLPQVLAAIRALPAPAG